MLPFPPTINLSRTRLRLYAATAGVAAAAITCASLLIGLALAQESPAWWRRVNHEDPTIKRTASDLENDLISTVSLIRPLAKGATPSTGAPGAASDPWEFSVSAAEANAWLSTKLPRWLANQSDHFTWPREISEIQVDFQDDRVLLGVELKTGESSSQILCAAVTPRLEGGSLYAPADSLALGRLPIPKGWLLSSSPLSMAESRIPEPLRELPQTSDLAAAFAGSTPVVQSPVIRLGDGRRVRLLSVTPRDGELHITCCTEQR